VASEGINLARLCIHQYYRALLVTKQLVCSNLHVEVQVNAHVRAGRRLVIEQLMLPIDGKRFAIATQVGVEAAFQAGLSKQGIRIADHVA